MAKGRATTRLNQARAAFGKLRGNSASANAFGKFKSGR